MPLPSMMPGTIKKPPPMPKKPEKAPTIRPIVTRRTAIAGVMLTEGSPSAGQHGNADRDHCKGKQKQKPVAGDQLADRGADRRPGNAGGGERRRARPFHVTCAPVADQIAEGIERDRKRTRADGDMRIADADDVEQERHSEYRAATADQAERKSDRAA